MRRQYGSAATIIGGCFCGTTSIKCGSIARSSATDRIVFSWCDTLAWVRNESLSVLRETRRSSCSPTSAETSFKNASSLIPPPTINVALVIMS